MSPSKLRRRTKSRSRFRSALKNAPLSVGAGKPHAGKSVSRDLTVCFRISADRFEGRLLQRHSFKYDVYQDKDCVKVKVGRYRWVGFLISLLWSTLWLLTAISVRESWWGETYFAYLFLLFCTLFIGFGVVLAVNSVLWRTLILSASGLRLRTSFFGVAISRTIDLSDVNNLGFGYASHSSIPTLRLELRTPNARTKWIVLASGTTENEVTAFLRDIEAKGFRLP